jgi:hypothetical protein
VLISNPGRRAVEELLSFVESILEMTKRKGFGYNIHHLILQSMRMRLNVSRRSGEDPFGLQSTRVLLVKLL